jgi:hypothetical protein
MRRKRLPVLITTTMAGLAGVCLLPAVASGSVPPGPHAAKVPAACHRSYNPYKVAKSFLRRCGDGIYPVLKVKALPGGGKEYEYNVDGLATVIQVPPRGFKPLRASAAKLAEYGYPARPRGGVALRNWIVLMRRDRPLTPSPYLVTDNPLEALWAHARISVPTNRNFTWAGNMATSNTYTNVYGYWLEPNIYSTQCTSPTIAESTWVGLGGWNQNLGILAQDGTAYGEGNLGIGPHEAWYEIIDQNTGVNNLVPLGVSATPGGEFYSITDRVSGGYHFYVENLYAGGSMPASVSFSPYDGSTAEMIVEDPNGGSDGSKTSGPDLANFKNFEVEDAEASNNNGSSYAGLANWPHDDDIMISSGDHATMAYPGGAFNSGDSWYDYQTRCY